MYLQLLIFNCWKERNVASDEDVGDVAGIASLLVVTGRTMMLIMESLLMITTLGK